MAVLARGRQRHVICTGCLLRRMSMINFIADTEQQLQP